MAWDKNNKITEYEFDYVESPDINLSDSYWLSKEPISGDTGIDWWQNIVGDIEGAYSAIQQNEDNINLRVEKDDVINQINISDEWILIDANNIRIDGTTTFGSGYDPSVKLDSSDVWDMAFEDLVEEAKLGSTIIDWWYIATSLLTADNIKTGTLEWVSILQDSGSWEHIKLYTDVWLPKIEFRDDYETVGYLTGDSNYSTSIGGVSVTLDAIRTSKDFICGRDLFVEDDLLVNDQLFVAGNSVFDGDVDMRGFDITNLQTMYIRDIYWYSVSEIDVYDSVNMQNNAIVGQGEPSFSNVSTTASDTLSYDGAMRVTINGSTHYFPYYS